MEDRIASCHPFTIAGLAAEAQERGRRRRTDVVRAGNGLRAVSRARIALTHQAAMKVTAVRVFRVEGEMEGPAPFWEERLSRPVDLYPEHHAEGAQFLPPTPAGGWQIVAHFLEIETDEGITGR